MLGRDGQDPLFLQAKEAEPSVLERFLPKCTCANQGERVVAGQHVMQAASDIFLGWERADGVDGVRRDYYVRQLRDWKLSLDPSDMVPTGMGVYGRVCGWTLARAHARSGDRIAIASYLGTSPSFDTAIATFAEAYADQNQLDYEELQHAERTGHGPDRPLTRQRCPGRSARHGWRRSATACSRSPPPCWCSISPFTRRAHPWSMCCTNGQRTSATPSAS